jgi:hypothetical protein
MMTFPAAAVAELGFILPALPRYAGAIGAECGFVLNRSDVKRSMMLIRAERVWGWISGWFAAE